MSFSSLYTQWYTLNKYRTCSNYIRGNVGIRSSGTRCSEHLPSSYSKDTDLLVWKHFKLTVWMSLNTNVSSFNFQLGFSSKSLTRIKLKDLAKTCRFSRNLRWLASQTRSLFKIRIPNSEVGSIVTGKKYRDETVVFYK